jgi:hypothetical protein
MIPNISALRNVDIRTVDRASLIDLKDVPINRNLPRHERLADFVRRIGNPYCYKCGDVVVKESHSSNDRTLEDCLEQYIGTLI